MLIIAARAEVMSHPTSPSLRAPHLLEGAFHSPEGESVMPLLPTPSIEKNAALHMLLIMLSIGKRSQCNELSTAPRILKKSMQEKLRIVPRILRNAALPVEHGRKLTVKNVAHGALRIVPRILKKLCFSLEHIVPRILRNAALQARHIMLPIQKSAALLRRPGVPKILKSLASMAKTIEREKYMRLSMTLLPLNGLPCKMSTITDVCIAISDAKDD
jgi:hypothetical protein